MNDHIAFSVRRGIRQPFQIEAGVPEHAKPELRAWLVTALLPKSAGGPTVDDRVRRLANVLHIPLPAGQKPIVALGLQLDRDPDLHLDALDYMVSSFDAAQLNQILERATSAYRAFKAPDNTWHLEEVVTASARAQYDAALAAGGEVADDLSEAWRKAYGRDADGADAWQHAIRAIEGALRPIVAPSSTSASIGQIIGLIKAKPEKWVFELTAAPGDGPGTGADILPTLYLVGYDPGRHAGNPPPDLGPARAVVHAATSVAEWARQGAFRQNPDQWK